jgi:hypothetical protein
VVGAPALIFPATGGALARDVSPRPHATVTTIAAAQPIVSVRRVVRSVLIRIVSP